MAPCSSGDPNCWNGDVGFPDLFKQDKFYRNGEWNDSTATAYTNALGSSTTGTGACDYANNRWECRACVQAKGYWVDRTNRNRAVFSGKFLNFYPPKFVVARTVVKNVIWNIKEVRMGLTRFNGSTGGDADRRAQPSLRQVPGPGGCLLDQQPQEPDQQPQQHQQGQLLRRHAPGRGAVRRGPVLHHRRLGVQRVVRQRLDHQRLQERLDHQ